MGVRAKLLGAAAGLLAGLQAAGQFVGWTFAYAPALEPGLRLGPEHVLYPPWAIVHWRGAFGDEEPKVFGAANALLVLGLAGGLGLGVLFDGDPRGRRTRGWGALKEARRAGLLRGRGCVIGELSGRILATDDLRPTLVTGGTRSGKGRGHVVPSLLCWTASALVHDPKGELWRLTAGWRGTFSHALYFSPRNAHSARWNPLAEIRPGPAELAQVQRLVAILITVDVQPPKTEAELMKNPLGIRIEDVSWTPDAS